MDTDHRSTACADHAESCGLPFGGLAGHPENQWLWGKQCPPTPTQGAASRRRMTDDAELRTAPSSPALQRELCSCPWAAADSGECSSWPPVLSRGWPSPSCPAGFPGPHCPFPAGLHSDTCSSERHPQSLPHACPHALGVLVVLGRQPPALPPRGWALGALAPRTALSTSPCSVSTHRVVPAPPDCPGVGRLGHQRHQEAKRGCGFDQGRLEMQKEGRSPVGRARCLVLA